MSIEKNISKLESKFPQFSDVFKVNVWQVLKEEREYQEELWNEDTTETKGFHSVPEWLTFIREYLNEAGAHMSRQPDPKASIMAVNCLRKVSSMILAATEQHDSLQSLISWMDNLENTEIFDVYTVSGNNEKHNVITEKVVQVSEDSDFSINTINELVTFSIGQCNKAIDHYSDFLNKDFESYENKLFPIFYAYLSTSTRLNFVISRSDFELKDYAWL